MSSQAGNMSRQAGNKSSQADNPKDHILKVSCHYLYSWLKKFSEGWVGGFYSYKGSAGLINLLTFPLANHYANNSPSV